MYSEVLGTRTRTSLWAIICLHIPGISWGHRQECSWAQRARRAWHQVESGAERRQVPLPILSNSLRFSFSEGLLSLLYWAEHSHPPLLTKLWTHTGRIFHSSASGGGSDQPSSAQVNPPSPLQSVRPLSTLVAARCPPVWATGQFPEMRGRVVMNPRAERTQR